MKNLRSRFERFCYQNRNKGIPNLMLYIVIGCGIVTALGLLGFPQIYGFLLFDRNAILQGQVWRLFTWVFTAGGGNILTTLILLYCYYLLGRAIENAWGSLKFSLFYLSGILLMDIFAMACGGIEIVDEQSRTIYTSQYFSSYYSIYMSSFLHLSMILCYSTIYSQATFLLLMLIPIKAWLLALFYLAYILFEVVQMCTPVFLFPHCLFPLVAILNYLLFFGADVLNLFPSLPARKKKQPVNIHIHKETSKTQSYTHRCTVCGRTDVSNPELEFRYCSRCNGYFCYCEDHINNHTHVE